MSEKENPVAIIHQDGFTNEFKRAISRNISFIKAQKVNDEWVWIVNRNEINLEEIENKLYDFPAYDVNLLYDNVKDVLISSAVKLESLKSISSNDVMISEREYTIVGDVHDVYSYQDITYYYTIIDNQDLKIKLEAVVKKEILENLNLKYEDLIDSRVVLTGTIILSKYLHLQLKVKKINILGPCSRLQQLEEWQFVCDEIIEDTKRNKEIGIISKIGLITGTKTRGYYDFMANINNRYISKDNIIIKDIVFTYDNIIKAIRELNQEDECQIICIVRGGGDPEELLQFSNPKLLYAICNSRIFIVTGIGHDSDDLLCDVVADAYTSTPTAAANFINKELAKQRKYEKESKSKTIDWKKRCIEAEEYIEELEKQIIELANKLEKKDNRGLLRRIFNC